MSSLRIGARAGLAALLLVAVACRGDAVAPPPPPATVGGSSPTSSPPTRSVQPPEVLDFEAQDLAGGVIRGADYAGKDLAIWFWAPW